MVTVEDLKLDTKGGVERYSDFLLEYTPDVVIIDPMRAFFAGSENDSDAVERWFTALSEASGDIPPSLIFTHHIAKGETYERGSKGSARGSGLITDRPSTALALTVNKEQTEWKVEFTKTRNRFRHPDTIMLGVNAKTGLFELSHAADPTTSYVLRVVEAVGGKERMQPEVVKELAKATGADERTVRDWITKAVSRGLIHRVKKGEGAAAPYRLIPLELTE